MGGGTGNSIEAMPTHRTVWTMRHGQTELKSGDPHLTDRGCKQAVEASQKHLAGIYFNAIYCGTRIRHVETAGFVKMALGISYDIFKTLSLSLTDDMTDAANKCAMECRDHSNRPAVGFRVDAWIETDVLLMNDCFDQFQDFLRHIPNEIDTVLAVSSSPIIESATLDPENTRLLGECGIIKYVIDDAGTIISSETIFEGFFEKPPQKKSS